MTTQERGPNITTVFRNRILRTSLPSSSKIIAIVINEATDHKTGEHCWLSIETIAERASLTKNTVKTHLKNLVQGGYIIQEKIQLLDQLPTGCYKSDGYLYKISLDWEVDDRGSTIDPANDSPPQGSTIDPPKGQPLTPTSSLTQSSDQEKKEEEVQESIDGENDNDAPPPPDLILDHQGTPLAARDGILARASEDQSSKSDFPDNIIPMFGPATSPRTLAEANQDRDEFEAWAQRTNHLLGVKLRDAAGATEARAKLLVSALETFAPGGDLRGRCEWVNSRFTDYTSRTLEDRGPNPPSSVHQALQWLEAEMIEGRLAKFLEAKQHIEAKKPKRDMFEDLHGWRMEDSDDAWADEWEQINAAHQALKGAQDE